MFPPLLFAVVPEMHPQLPSLVDVNKSFGSCSQSGFRLTADCLNNEDGNACGKNF